MAEPTDKKLYNKIKKLADKKFLSKTGIYKSSWIVREYKKQGGKFKGAKPKMSGLKRWYKEKWVDLNRPKRNSKGKVIGYEQCGRTSINKKGVKYPLCRPTYVISSKTPKTYKELSDKSIRKAKISKSKIKHQGNIHFDVKGGAQGKQYFGNKQKSKFLVKVPKEVKKVAIYAFRLKKIGFQGATETGWRRAKQLATQDTIPIEDLRYMRNWFARHIIASYPTFREWQRAGRPKTKEWYDKHGIISWITWAGNAGFKWVNSKRNIELLNRYFDKNYQKIKF